MRLLAIDTATEACSAALMIGDEVLLRHEEVPRLHAKLILSMVQDLLTEADVSLTQLEGIGVGQGPGSFTGVRIGLSSAQGLALGADLGLIGVSDLASVAQILADQHSEENIAVAFDARMDEIYWGCYQRQSDGLVQLQGEESVQAPETAMLTDASKQWIAGGRGWAAYASRFSSGLRANVTIVDDNVLPTAATIVRLAAKGKAIPPEELTPVYLRNTVAWKKSA